MTNSHEGDCCQALSELVAEMTGVARNPAHTDPAQLRRVRDAFGRVRDDAPDAYRSDRSLAAFHAEAEYFAADGEPADQLPLFGGEGS